MTNANDLGAVIGKTAYDSDGDKIGKVGQVYLNDQSGQPEWVTVKTGMFGSKESFAPLYGSSIDGEDLRLAVNKQMVKDAPNVDDDGHMDEDESDALYAHYRGHTGSETTGQSEHDDDAVHASGRHNDLEGNQLAGDTREDLTGRPGVQGRDTSGPTTDDAMTRSEERLHVGTKSVQTGKARLRKYVVEEDVTTTVPVSHEEVRIEREPITEANRGEAMAGSELSEEEHEITLHAERPVVSKEAVPVDRVKLGTETITEDAQVEETVRKEQIDQVEGVETDARPRP